MPEVIFEISSLNGSNVPELLKFSKFGYISSDHELYSRRISSSYEISKSINDGGVFDVLKDSNIGDIVLNNIDGGLDYLKSYAFDGQPIVVKRIIDGTPVTVFTGHQGVPQFDLENVIITIKDPQEKLNDNITLDIYDGDNVAPLGLEGSSTTIKGNVKPIFLGDGRNKNITPVLVNEQLLIYQVSSLANCRIFRVRDNGVPLDNYSTSAAHDVGDDTITLHNGLGNLPVGAQIYFINHTTLYTLTNELTSGTIEITPALTNAVPINTPVTVVNFYSDLTTSGIQYVDYSVDVNCTKGTTIIPVSGGSGSIDAGDYIIFNNQLKAYEVLTGISSGNIVLVSPLSEDIIKGSVIQVIGLSNPVLWGAYQGFFRLSSAPVGEITVDAVSIDDTSTIHKVGDVLDIICARESISLSSDSITTLNNCGYLALNITTTESKLSVINKIIKSVGGYYYFDGSELNVKLFEAPASPIFTIYDYQIKEKQFKLIAKGICKNKLPCNNLTVSYDKVETIQTTLAGSVPQYWKERVKTEFRKKDFPYSVTKTRHLLSETFNIESLLCFLSDVNTEFTRLFNLIKVDKNVIEISVDLNEFLDYELGDTITLSVSRYDYGSGKDCILLGYSQDDNEQTLTFRLFG